ncbi:MAG: hypothetical protein HW380_415 [Magnetococcales bacterium]|nr:hypothetical protein [Magnetococcales bacterium]
MGMRLMPCHGGGICLYTHGVWAERWQLLNILVEALFVVPDGGAGGFLA